MVWTRMKKKMIMDSREMRLNSFIYLCSFFRRHPTTIARPITTTIARQNKPIIILVVVFKLSSFELVVSGRSKTSSEGRKDRFIIFFYHTQPNN
jgi:hypothetical protein